MFGLVVDRTANIAVYGLPEVAGAGATEDCSCPTEPRRQTVDAGVQVGHGDGAAGCGQVGMIPRQAGDGAVSSGGADTAPSTLARSGGSGLGLRR
jgi:hypothetical protein